MRFVEFGRGPTPPNTFSFLELTLGTGDDDLRDDSLATATLLDSSSQTFQKLILREQNQPAWKDDTHVTDFALSSPVTASQLGSLVLTLKQGGGAPETPDNWDVLKVRVKLFNTDPAALPPVCLFNQSGSPLVRLTDTVPSTTFTLTSGACP
jgi:hypothetical protein